MKRISLVVLAALSIVWIAGCFQRVINFDPPPYQLVETPELPARVNRAFKSDHPNGTIEKVESLTWPPTGKQHFRITFAVDGETMQVEYREGGAEIRGSLRSVQTTDEQDSEIADGTAPQ